MGDKSDGFNLDDLARQLAQSLPKNLRALGGDIERNFRALLQAGLEKMDLVTREEFDVQSAVLERTREKLEKIDARLGDLERGLAARKRTASASGGSKAEPRVAAAVDTGLKSSGETGRSSEAGPSAAEAGRSSVEAGVERAAEATEGGSEPARVPDSEIARSD